MELKLSKNLEKLRKEREKLLAANSINNGKIVELPNAEEKNFFAPGDLPVVELDSKKDGINGKKDGNDLERYVNEKIAWNIAHYSNLDDEKIVPSGEFFGDKAKFDYYNDEVGLNIVWAEVHKGGYITFRFKGYKNEPNKERGGR